MQNSINF